MSLTDLVLSAVCAVLLLLCLRLFVGCTFAAVSVDCAMGEAGVSQ